MGCGQSKLPTAAERSVHAPPQQQDPADDLKVEELPNANFSPVRKGRPPQASTVPTLNGQGDAEDAQFTSILTLVNMILQAPLAAVCLVNDAGRCIVRAVGPALAEQLHGQQQELLKWALAVTSQQQVAVEDAAQHELLKDAPFVAGPPGIRFFAGAPLLSSSLPDGQRVLGVLCMLDVVPRSCDPGLLDKLASFASLAAQEAERRQAERRAQASEAVAAAAVHSAQAARPAASSMSNNDEEAVPASLLRQALCMPDGALLVDVRHAGWPVLCANTAWELAARISTQQAMASCFWELFRPWNSGSAASSRASSGAGTTTAETSAGSSGGAVGSSSSGRARAACAPPPAVQEAVALGMPVCVKVVAPGKQRPMRMCLRPAAVEDKGAVGREASSGWAMEPGSPMTMLAEVPSSVTASFASTTSLGPAGQAAALAGSASSGLPASPGPTPFWFVVVVSGQRQQGSAGSALAAPAASAQSLREVHTERLPSDGPSLGSPANSAGAGLSSSAFVDKYRQRQAEAIETATSAALTSVAIGPVIGAGSFGRVHRGFWKGAPVAVKVMEIPCMEGDSSVRTSGALLEAVLARDLSHPNIVQTFDYAVRYQQLERGQGGPARALQQVFIVQQFCNRGTLTHALDKGWLQQTRVPGSAPNAIAILQTAQEIASAMTYLHSLNVVHGDLTSNNVLLHASMRDARRFTSLVSDFGLSRLTAPTGGARTYSFGTIGYMPPELLAEGLVSKAVDVYSFGVLLWEMWMGCHAWEGCPQVQVLHLVTTRNAKLELPPETPAGYKDLCERCLSFDHTQRPAFEAVLREVMALLEAELAASTVTEQARTGGYAGARLSLDAGSVAARDSGAAVTLASLPAPDRVARQAIPALDSAASPFAAARGAPQQAPWGPAALPPGPAVPPAAAPMCPTSRPPVAFVAPQPVPRHASPFAAASAAPFDTSAPEIGRSADQ